MSINLKNTGIWLTKETKGPFKVVEYEKDPSVGFHNAFSEYYAGKMNVRKRQVVCRLRAGQNSIVTQSGAMQWTAGNINCETGIKGVGDFVKKSFVGKVTGERPVTPVYTGEGFLTLEPTYKHILLQDMAEWPEGMVVEDGMFLASEGSVRMTPVMRQNISSATLGGEGLFNMCFDGNGIVALESNVPREELIEIELDRDVVKIDGSYAVCWSKSLQFTVERSSKTLIGSAVNGEGFVNVYRGTGRILLCPTVSSTRSFYDAANS